MGIVHKAITDKHPTWTVFTFGATDTKIRKDPTTKNEITLSYEMLLNNYVWGDNSLVDKKTAVEHVKNISASLQEWKNYDVNWCDVLLLPRSLMDEFSTPAERLRERMES